MSDTLTRQDLIALIRGDKGPTADQKHAQAFGEYAQWVRDLNSGKVHADIEAQRRAETEAEARKRMTAAELLMDELAKLSGGSEAPEAQVSTQSPLPLNGVALSRSLKSVLSGMGSTVTINGA
jgi:hypothetical protein